MRAMLSADIGIRQCEFVPAWSQQCSAPTLTRFCAQHSGIVCQVCGAPASNECSYCGQFVCGVPLCDECQGWEDTSKPSGSWGFMNHGHRRKPTAPPLTKMNPEDIGVSL